MQLDHRQPLSYLDVSLLYSASIEFVVGYISVIGLVLYYERTVLKVEGLLYVSDAMLLRYVSWTLLIFFPLFFRFI